MNILLLVIIVLLQMILISFFIISSTFYNDEIYFFGVPIHLIFVVFLNIVSLFLLGKINQRASERKIQFTESTYEEQFRALVASVRSDRHDLNNHLTVIFGLLKTQNYDSARNYIKEMIGDIEINNQALAIRNPILASMLFSKMDKFQKEGVSFHVNILTETIENVLSPTDLIRLISNLLDNAYDATTELPKEQQKVILEILEFPEYISIIAKNSSSILSFDNKFLEMGYSTKSKENSTSRGYGLSIIQEVTKKYHALFDIKIQDDLVTIEIQFPKKGINDQTPSYDMKSSKINY